MVNTHSWCLCASSNIPSWWGLKYCFYLYFTGGKTMVQRVWVIQGYFTVSINEWINGVQALVCLVSKPSWTETNSHRKQVYGSVQFSSVAQLHPTLWTPWTAAHQTSLSITNSRSLLKVMSIELVMPSDHLILCHPLLLLPSIFPSIRVFSSESVLCIRWPKY